MAWCAWERDARFVELLRHLAAEGRTLPVVPGTRHLTVGGAIASDVHGKNHVRDGSFARHVHSFTLLTPNLGATDVSAESAPELFAATLGGMGLTGLISQATLATVPLGTGAWKADFDAARSLPEALELMAAPSPFSHTIAWIDLLSGGTRFGRSIVMRSVEASLAGAPRAAAPRERPLLAVPEAVPAGLLRRSTVAAFNACYWHLNARRGHGRVLDMGANLFPLDGLGAWNRLYGPDGLLQYQFAVPGGADGVLLETVEALRARGIPIYLAALKRFGEPSGGLLSFPIAGWTLAIDIPAGAPGLGAALDEQDERIADSGGRVYLAKDSRVRAGVLARMYPQIERFREVRSTVDPDGRLRSDMARRLGL